MNQNDKFIAKVAIPLPKRDLFDYIIPKGMRNSLQPGLRVLVPVQKRQVVGIVVALHQESQLPEQKLRKIIRSLDEQVIFDDHMMCFAKWAYNYYQHPPGEVFYAMLPKLLRLPKRCEEYLANAWQLTSEGMSLDDNDLRRASRQQQLIQYLKQHGQATTAELNKLGIQSTIVNKLKKLNYVCAKTMELQLTTMSGQGMEKSFKLNSQQQNAKIEILKYLNTFRVMLLQGITGSGKTEVYLQVIREVITKGKQALVLVPEISLTPQTVQRFRNRFNQPIVVLHSGLTDKQRLQAWLAAKDGQAKIIIGTRSAVFVPCVDLGIIIVDEEHDASFKQQEGWRYSARDLAVIRGRIYRCPVILGSATPALESLQNASSGRYQLLRLTERAGSAIVPKFSIIDLRNRVCKEGLSDTLLTVMNKHLTNKGQVLLFKNRRGFAPVLICGQCGWSAHCHRCDAKLVVHLTDKKLRCHHCANENQLPTQCLQCHSQQLTFLGLGTQRVEEILRKQFPEYTLIRIDRDTVRNKGAMGAVMKKIQQGHSQILIGTQMLAKGHHFPNVTLVAILDVDMGLYSGDFRATERLCQTIIQVAGRAGRADRPGEVILQSYYPNHPILLRLIKEGYLSFAEVNLAERQQAQLPPFSYQALLRAESVNAKAPMNFLQSVRDQGQLLQNGDVNLYGPIPAIMLRKAGRHRAQLMIESQKRQALHGYLQKLLSMVEQSKASKQVRWSLDIDPWET